MAVPEVGVGPAATLARPTIAGHPWLVRAPAPTGALLDSSFGHLPLWDLAENQVSCTVHHTTTPQAELPTTGTLRRVDSGVVYQEFPGAAVQYDRVRAQFSITMFGADPLDTAIRTELFTRLVMLWATDRGLVPLHAAAIGAGGHYWLIPAAGGSGKSTATAVALGAGLQVLGDDLLLWDPTTDVLHSVSATLRLLPGWLATVDAARCGLIPLWRRPDGKAVLRIPVSAMRAAGRLAGLLLIGETAPPPTPAAALRGLSSSLFQLTRLGIDPAPRATHLGGLARRAPLRSLRRDPDLTAWGRTLAELCRG